MREMPRTEPPYRAPSGRSAPAAAGTARSSRSSRPPTNEQAVDLQRAEALGHSLGSLQRSASVRPSDPRRPVAPTVRFPSADAPVQRARGGMEYTEGGTTTLTSHAGGGAPADTTRAAMRTFGATPVEAYQVPDAHLAAWAGAARDTDHLVFRQGRIQLTNDVRSAEWVIEGHGADLAAGALVEQTLQDVASLYRFRRDLKAFIDVNTIAGHTTVIAPDGRNDLTNPGPQGLFVYKPDDAAAGKVQITAQYANVHTIRRINELNASKFLTGTKVAEGQDASRVASDPGWFETKLGGWNTSSSATAAALLADLAAQSAYVVGGRNTLAPSQVALIKLMVINDAMASNMSRFRAVVGEAQEKNIQRFFPKAQRQTYVKAVAQANVSADLLAALRVHILASQAAMAQVVWDRADPFALTLDESIRERTVGAATTAVAAPLTITNAQAAAATVPPGNVTAAIAAVGGMVAREVGGGAIRPTLVPRVALDITAHLGIVDPHATAIAGVVVGAAIEARDNVTAGVVPLMTARQENAAGRPTGLADRSAIKNLVLGPNGALLAAWIGRTADAYTDATGAAHVDAATGTGRVISSTRGYTPLAGTARGAIYEFREREVDMSDGNRTAIRNALTKLFGSVD